MFLLFISLFLKSFLLLDRNFNFFLCFFIYSFSFYLVLVSYSEFFLLSILSNLDLSFNLIMLFNNLWMWDNFCWNINLFDNLNLLFYFAFFWMARRMALFWLTNWLTLCWFTWRVTYIWSTLWFWFTIIFSNWDSVGRSNQKWKDKGRCSHLYLKF